MALFFSGRRKFLFLFAGRYSRDIPAGLPAQLTGSDPVTAAFFQQQYLGIKIRIFNRAYADRKK